LNEEAVNALRERGTAEGLSILRGLVELANFLMS